MKCVIDGCNNEATTFIGIDRDEGAYCKVHYDEWMHDWDTMCDDLKKLSFEQIMYVFGV